MFEETSLKRPLVVQVAAERTNETRPRSIQIYAEAIRSRLQARGVRLLDVPFEETRMLPEADLVWAPGLGNRRVPLSLFAAGSRAVATIHGLTYLGRGPEIRELGLVHGLGHYRWRRMIRSDWKRLGPRIGAGISVSETLKPELTGLLRIPQERVRVIPHGINALFVRPSPPTSGPSIKGDYILHVCQYSRIKNLPGVLAAYQKVRNQIGLPLRIVAGGWDGDLASLAQGVEMTNTLVPQDKVRELMWGARVFLFPSFEEPFGLPVLEAMASGVPVVTSRGTGAGEVVGDAGLCVDPHDVDAIAAALLAASTDKALHERLALAGYERAKGYNWDVAADRHLALFTQLVQQAEKGR